jgi:elongation factor P--(R)-beta-lysine ligase
MEGDRIKKVERILSIRQAVMTAIRLFFYDRGYTEVETPSLMKTAPPDPYIEPLKVFVNGCDAYLHTSPEIGMKKLLAMGQEKIFQICKVFRTEEFEEVHSIEFTMLEWYRPGTYVEAMQDTEALVRYVADVVGGEGKNDVAGPWSIFEISELFERHAGINPLTLDRTALFERMIAVGFSGLSSDDTWQDLFFKLFVQDVEPRIELTKPYFIKDWPALLTAMAHKKDEHTVERFELYIHGLEIANGYTELLDPIEQRVRLEKDNITRVETGKPEYSLDREFLAQLGSIRGPVAGVSIGIDRLIMALMHLDHIEDILTDRFRL